MAWLLTYGLLPAYSSRSWLAWWLPESLHFLNGIRYQGVHHHRQPNILLVVCFIFLLKWLLSFSIRRTSVLSAVIITKKSSESMQIFLPHPQFYVLEHDASSLTREQGSWWARVFFFFKKRINIFSQWGISEVYKAQINSIYLFIFSYRR
jgi:hypothetical protein